MSGASDPDIRHALAAIGPTALSYRNFDANDSGSTDTGTSSFAATFPLLADALPEIAARPVKAGAERPAAESDHIEPPVVRADEQQPNLDPAAPSSNPQPPAEITGTSPQPRDWSSRRQNGTALAGVFQLLRGHRQTQSPSPKPGLNELFRRL